MRNPKGTNDLLSRGEYRLEIDGLRAFAVIAVIINHFNKEFLPSGYLGVDIFFVISGYVITSSLLRRKNKNFVDFITSFYERRIKRLLPALILFVLITSIFICFFDANPLFSLRTGISSLFGLSNLYLIRASTNYFAESTDFNVFTHTWSLGVEEQFYILFPFITWVTGFSRQTSKGAKNLFLVLLFLAIFSFFAFVSLYSTNQSAAYFLMPTRFWEIATGCLLFLGFQKRLFIFEILENTSPLVVLTAIIGFMFMPKSFGIGSTIAIVCLSSLLILCLREGKLFFKLFTNRNVTHIGLISYSLYLWHWGVLSISRFTIGIHWWSIPIQVLLIYFLAVSSYKFVETPLRNKKWSLNKSKTIFKGLIALLFSATALVGLNKSLKEKLFLGDIQSFDNIAPNKDCKNISFKKGYIHQMVLSKCLKSNVENKQTFFFLGDSHNNHFESAAELIADKTHSNFFRLSYSATSFPAIKYFLVNQRQTHLEYFKNFKSFEKEIFSSLNKRDVFFIINRYPYHFGPDWFEYPVSQFRFFDKKNKVVKRNSKRDHFDEWLFNLDAFAKNLSEKDVKVVIFTPTPEFPMPNLCKGKNDQWFNQLSRKNCEIPIEFFTSKNGKYSHIIKKLKKVSLENQNLYLFDALNIMCPEEKCSYSLEDKGLYNDTDHLSIFSTKNILEPRILRFLEKKKIISFEKNE